MDKEFKLIIISVKYKVKFVKTKCKCLKVLIQIFFKP